VAAHAYLYPMAARRLMILLMALIAVSMAITVIAQPLRNNLRSQTTSTATSPPQERVRTTDPDSNARAPQDKSISATFGPQESERVTIGTGDRLTLLVEVDQPSEVSIGGLGLTAFADPYAPARFDILARVPGRFPVRTYPGGRSGVIEVLRNTRSGSR
jgi:hypothetical protein